MADAERPIDLTPGRPEDAPGWADPEMDGHHSRSHEISPGDDYEARVARPDLFSEEDVLPGVVRAFAFLDICGFTAFTDRMGPHVATEYVGKFRSLVRQVSVRRGVRVSKWLGDGVMLVGVEVAPLISTVVELLGRSRGEGLPLRGGIAQGIVLFFEGDDYIGRPVNLAARLCDAAARNQVLAEESICKEAPNWVTVVPRSPMHVPGFEKEVQVCAIDLEADLSLPSIISPAPTNVGITRLGQLVNSPSQFGAPRRLR